MANTRKGPLGTLDYVLIALAVIVAIVLTWLFTAFVLSSQYITDAERQECGTVDFPSSNK